jgi:hypothetical protein
MPITKEVTLYTFDELDDDAKEVAREWFRSCDPHLDWSGEWQDTLKAFTDQFPVEAADWQVGPFYPSHCDARFTGDGDAAELAGVRAWKWLHNNGFATLHGTPIQYAKESYTLTGYCADWNILEPLALFLARPDPRTTLEDLMQDCLTAWASGYQADMEDALEDEQVDDMLRANEYTFTAAGAGHPKRGRMMTREQQQKAAALIEHLARLTIPSEEEQEDMTGDQEYEEALTLWHFIEQARDILSEDA